VKNKREGGVDIAILVRRFEGEDGLEALFALWAARPHTVRLQGGWDPKGQGRFTFLGVDPYAVLCSTMDHIGWYGPKGWRYCTEDPFAALMAGYEKIRREPMDADLPFPFQGGAMGFLGYELRRFVERLPARARRDVEVPDLFFAFFDLIAVYDHLEDATYLVSTGMPLEGSDRKARAIRRLNQALSWMDEGAHRTRPRPVRRCGEPDAFLGEALSVMSKAEYIEMVQRAKAYIAAGDVYQVNLSQRFCIPCTLGPEDLFFALRSANPAPFGAYIRGHGWSVVSVSPERFFRFDGQWVETRPIKGTRPRATDQGEDLRLAEELYTSAKDQAEHVMIVDLERNDLGRFCRYGSLHVPQLMALEAHPTVWHLVSTVRGAPQDPRRIIEGLRAAFPGGSITGAPKVRAMEIIDELEPVTRGVYTGSIGYLGRGGQIDLNIAIRTLTLTKGRAYFHVGGGIVADSNPEAEYHETLDKGLGIARGLASVADEGSGGRW